MGIHAIRLPDVGEGIAEAELVEWPVAIGDVVRVDDVVAVVMTDKASVEIPTPVEGTIAWLGGEVGDTLAVGSELIRIEVDGEGNVREEAGGETSAPRPAKVTNEKPVNPDAQPGQPIPAQRKPAPQAAEAQRAEENASAIIKHRCTQGRQQTAGSAFRAQARARWRD